jgi:hypothetical protein
MSMIKGKRTFLLVFSGIVVLFVVATFAFSKGMRENFIVTTNLLLPKHNTLPIKPSPNRNNEIGSPQPITNSQQEGIVMETNTPQQKNDNTPTGVSVYRNNEFGFEFTIPDGWQVRENPYGSPYSYFNLILLPLKEKAIYLEPVAINIVKPEFIEMSYAKLKPIDDTVVLDGVKGVKYQYFFEGGQNTDLIFPRKEDTFMIGFRKGYDDIFYQVITSFKFLNKN